MKSIPPATVHGPATPKAGRGTSRRTMPGTYVALLRGVNVGGNRSLPMQDFVRTLATLGCKNVRTYIQSGNAVFQAPRTSASVLSDQIQTGILRNLGFAPDVAVLEHAELEAAIAANPYPAANADPKALHLVFLASTPAPSKQAALESARGESEQYTFAGRVLYFWAPAGVGRSKLFPQIERRLGVTGTARNWRTVRALLDLAREIAATTGERTRLAT